MNNLISEYTQQNWHRLNVSGHSRLTYRANKRLSTKKIIPLEYFSNKYNQNSVLDILDALDNFHCSIEDVLCTIAEKLFCCNGILEHENVQTVLSEYPYKKIEIIYNMYTPCDEKDLLGIIYQSYTTEGIRNQKGMYYTPYEVTSSMVSSLSFDNGQKFLDPCCGSGSFLLSLNCDSPEQLYGVDNDPIAVMIAKFNLLLHYPDENFIPNIYCENYLRNNPFSCDTFDYIVTNPPWGSYIENTKGIVNDRITSNETFSLFFVKAYQNLKENGIIRFLLPESILNVKVHKDIRTFILDNCCLNAITVYGSFFSGVTTNYIDIECQKKASVDTVIIKKDNLSYSIDIEIIKNNKNNVFTFLDSLDAEIIQKCNDMGKYTLGYSDWALGIVTGNNNDLLSFYPYPGLEPIYTGKDIDAYTLREPSNFIFFDKTVFQQVAKEEYYRAPEKLIYKFISKKLVFAYDNKRTLCLNSANILIPRVPGMSIKTIMAFLNSELFSYLYQKMFGEIKILKGNLLQLPFPEISPEQDCKISAMVDYIISYNSKNYESLEREIYQIFQLSDRQIRHIKNSIR